MKKQTRGSTGSKLDTADASVELARHDPRMRSNGGLPDKTHQCSVLYGGGVTDDDLSKHIGHRIEVKGKAADRGDGKVKIESTIGTSGGDKAKAKTEIKGDMAGMHHLGVKSFKMLSSSCM